jgi:hypothetical protein
MKNIRFSTTPDDEWVVNGNIIMYRCQDSSLYDDDIEWKQSSIAEAVEAMLDPNYPRLPQLRIIEQLKGTELGNLINQFQQGKLVFVPISMLEEWEDKKVEHLNKLVKLGELPSFAYQEESWVNGKHKVAWDLMLEIFCQQVNIPERCWVQIENSSNGYEVIEVVNRKPQYKGVQVFSRPGVNFECLLEIAEEKGEE